MAAVATAFRQSPATTTNTGINPGGGASVVVAPTGGGGGVVGVPNTSTRPDLQQPPSLLPRRHRRSPHLIAHQEVPTPPGHTTTTSSSVRLLRDQTGALHSPSSRPSSRPGATGPQLDDKGEFDNSSILPGCTAVSYQTEEPHGLLLLETAEQSPPEEFNIGVSTRLGPASEDTIQGKYPQVEEDTLQTGGEGLEGVEEEEEGVDDSDPHDSSHQHGYFGDFHSDTTPEAQLLSKFKHVYAGRGGWLGVPVPGPVSSDSAPVRSTRVVSLPRGRGVSVSSSGVGAVRRHRTMPKAQYERYKKEIMHKLARTIQSQEDAVNNNPVSNTLTASGDMPSDPMTTGKGNTPQGGSTSIAMKTGTNGIIVPPQGGTGNVTIPASWRLPVGWAGRNKNFLATGRPRQRKHHVGGERGGEDRGAHPSASTGRSLGGQPKSTSNVIQRVSATSTLRDRTHFTNSWVQSSAFGGPRVPLEAKGGQENGGVSGGGGGRPHPYTLRIGPLLGPDGDAPSRLNTDGLHSESNLGGIETSRTGITSQSLPLQNANHQTQRQHKRKNPRLLLAGNNGGSTVRMPPPTSSRRSSMNMFSRMSVEAQAALKEMGMGAEDGSSGGSDYTTEDEEEQEGMNKTLVAPEILNSQTLKAVVGTNKISGNAVIVQRGNSHQNPPSRPNATSNMPNLRSNSVDKPRPAKPAGVPHQSKNHILSDQEELSQSENKKGSASSSTRRPNSNTVTTKPKPLKKINTVQNPNLSEVSNSIDTSNKEVVVLTEDGQVSGSKLGSVSSTADMAHTKQCSCKVRAGIVLKNNTNNAKQPSITVRVTSPKHVTNGCVAHSDTQIETEQETFQVAPSQVSRARTRLPNIQESPTGSSNHVGANTAPTESTTPFLGTHRQIPGVGQYRRSPNATKPLVIKNWGKEKTFEITPVGYDSRFEDLAIKEDEVDETPDEIKEKAILKCTDWLKKYHSNT